MKPINSHRNHLNVSKFLTLLARAQQELVAPWGPRSGRVCLRWQCRARPQSQGLSYHPRQGAGQTRGSPSLGHLLGDGDKQQPGRGIRAWMGIRMNKVYEPGIGMAVVELQAAAPETLLRQRLIVPSHPEMDPLGPQARSGGRSQVRLVRAV